MTQDPLLVGPSIAVHVQLLGSFRLTCDGEPTAGFNSARLQALLAYLLLHRHEPQARAQLAFLFWPESTEAHAQLSLRKLLHQLRRRLPAAERLLSISAHSLQWLPDIRVQFDVAQFEEAIAEADGAERAGDSAAANAALDRAIDLYHGELLPSCYDEWIIPERERLHQLALRTLERQIVLAEGQHGRPEAIRYAQKLLRLDPLHEETYARLMRLHALNGDQVGALRVFQTCAAVLQRELGVAPSSATREAFRQLQDQSRVPQTGGADTPMFLRSATPAAHNLPVQMTSFVGRAREIDTIVSLLDEHRLLTITGGGGAGKTRLALQSGSALSNAGTFAHGIWFVELAALNDPRLVPDALAFALAVREQPGRPIAQTLEEYLKPRRLLLIIDNCEHLRSACAELSEALLRNCPQLRILATSREPLGVAGEHVWSVPPLALPPLPTNFPAVSEGFAEPHFTGQTQYAAESSEAVRLFVERASNVLPTFVLDPSSALHAAQICCRLDGNPLAIELAAARVRMLSVAQIAERINDALGLLSRGSSAREARHQTLAATIGWSYDLLSRKEQLLFRRLSVFAGSFTLEASEAICPADPGEHAAGDASPAGALEAAEVLDLLSDLADKSLLTVLVEREQSRAARYRLLETVRQYAWSKLAPGERETQRSRHLAYLLRLAALAEEAYHGPAQSSWLERLALEHDNIRAALDWALQIAPAAALRLSRMLYWFWNMRGFLNEGRGWIERALKATEGKASDEERAAALCGLGLLALVQTDFDAARLQLEQSVSGLRHSDDRSALAGALLNLAILCWYEGLNTEAQELYQESATLLTDSAAERSWQMGVALYGLSMVALVNGATDLAHAQMNRSLKISKDLGDTWGIARALNGLGEVVRSEGDYAYAGKLYAESLALFKRLDSPNYVSAPLINLAFVMLRQGDHVEAATRFKEALHLNQELGNRQSVALCLAGLACALAAQGRFVQAARLCGAAETLYEALGAFMIGPDRVEYERCLGLLRERLEPSTFDAAWKAGRTLTPLEAVADAQSPPDGPEAGMETG